MIKTLEILLEELKDYANPITFLSLLNPYIRKTVTKDKFNRNFQKKDVDCAVKIAYNNHSSLANDIP